MIFALPPEQLVKWNFSRRVLGVDTALRSSGVAVVQASGAEFSVVEYHVIKNPPSRLLSASLDNLAQSLAEIIERLRPEEAAVEGIFFCKNARTALALGQARGVVLAVCVAQGVPVFEYPARRVKQAVTGYGNAGKEQVRRMVMQMLKLKETPHEDAADALAIALCHLHAASRCTSVADTKVLLSRRI